MVLGQPRTRGPIRIWPYILPTGHENLDILILPLAHVLGQTRTRGLIRIWPPFIVPTAHEGSKILIEFWARPD